MDILIDSEPLDGYRDGILTYKGITMHFAVEVETNEIIFSLTSAKKLGDDIDNMKKEILKRL